MEVIPSDPEDNGERIRGVSDNEMVRESTTVTLSPL